MGALSHARLGLPGVISGVHYDRIFHPYGPAKPRSLRIGRLCSTYIEVNLYRVHSGQDAHND